VIVASVAGGLTEGARRASAAGADLVLARPHDADKLAPVLLAASRLGAERRAVTAARGAEAALRIRLEQVAHTDPGGLEPFELFQRALELEIKRARRYAYPLAVALFAVEIAPPPPPTGVRGILRARIGTAMLRAIRDIDLATQLDHERFLVLLPYTDLAGAATVGKRVLGAVAAGDAVHAGGRTFPLRVIGAVAGASPGQPLSFSRLMREATRALEQARRDGSELAVPS
jgi:PleD family two-component response regulator